MKIAFRASVALSALLSLASCEAIFNTMLTPDAPSSIDASDGEVGHIALSWSSVPNLSSSGASFSHYVVYRDGSPLTTTASTSISDYGVMSGVEYDYTVSAIYSDGYVASQVMGNSGFCVDALMEMRSTPTLVGQSSGNRWYRTFFQEGFAYTFSSQGGDFSVNIYQNRSIASGDRVVAEGGAVTWTWVATFTGVGIVNISVGASGAITVDY
jgi:hypothetical protein